MGRFAHIAGTLPSMALVIAGSLAWVFSGFALDFNNLWQIIMNDAGSVVCWFWVCSPIIPEAPYFNLQQTVMQSHSLRGLDCLLVVGTPSGFHRFK